MEVEKEKTDRILPEGITCPQEKDDCDGCFACALVCHYNEYIYKKKENESN